MPVFKWNTPGAWAAMFGSSDLNSCANGTTVLSTLSAPVVDTTTSLDLYFQAEFVGGSISPAAGGDVVFALVPRDSTDASYADGEATATVPNQPIWMQYPHVVIGLRAKASQTQLAVGQLVPLPPGKYLPMLLNRAGVSLASAGNQINLRLINEQAV